MMSCHLLLLIAEELKSGVGVRSLALASLTANQHVSISNESPSGRMSQTRRKYSGGRRVDVGWLQVEVDDEMERRSFNI